MTVREMHYDLKQKLNKIDSQKYRNLYVPEIDWKLNEAQEVFVKMIAMPRYSQQIGFEGNQRTIDDIRTIVINQKPEDGIVPSEFDEGSYIAALPDNYWFHASSRVLATKGNCTGVRLVTSIKQHDDEQEVSPFDRSSFEWRTINIRFIKEGIRIFTDKTFIVNKLLLNYIKRPVRIYNAQDWTGGTYNLLDGTALTGFQNCELAEGVHLEIVDLAVLIITGDLAIPSYQYKKDKIKLTN